MSFVVGLDARSARDGRQGQRQQGLLGFPDALRRGLVGRRALYVHALVASCVSTQNRVEAHFQQKWGAHACRPPRPPSAVLPSALPFPARVCVLL